ncbi:hypothetical protein EWM64_g3499 [Hericium alpestre]|uniref:F-box domain-containing protein n=1 Tax=Hericium alpestre TaxID=135208 RepID=A0A4Z0A2R5_9AGAM|nr:hypothetical protein EWM64_g3499 [Hericium alpestre]
MHRCLEMPEILQLIINFVYRIPSLSELDIDPTTITDFPSGNEDLMCLAVTCRRFSEPCLDALWYYLPGLGPLFSLLGLPADFVNEHNMDNDRDHYYSSAREYVEQADYTRFIAYARRVVGLVVDDEYIMRDDILLNIISISGRSPTLLTPHLRLLMWLKTPASLSYMSMFCGPALRHLSGAFAMDYDQHYDQLNQISYHAMLTHMRTLSLSLERLILTAPVYNCEPDPVPLMLCFPSIKEFSHNFYIEPAGVAHIAQMRNLRRLQTQDTFMFPLPPDNIGQPPLPALQDIYLDGVPLASLIELLRSFQTRRELQSVEFSIMHVTPDATVINEFFRVLHAYCIPGKLTKLILNFCGSDCPSDSESVRDVDCSLDDDAFLLLCDFTHLTSLRISCPSDF